jgi:hypothetical protein
MKACRSRSVTTHTVRRLDDNGMNDVYQDCRRYISIHLNVLHFVHVGMKVCRVKGSALTEGAKDSWTCKGRK